MRGTPLHLGGKVRTPSVRGGRFGLGGVCFKERVVRTIRSRVREWGITS